jgi:fructuronate reductase
VGDESCRAWTEEWWAEACAHLPQPAAQLAGYRAVLVERFANAAMGDRLERIAEDGSQKLPVRVLPVLRAERAAGRMPVGATRILAAWLGHLRGFGVPVRDVRAGELIALADGPLRPAAARVLAALDPALGDDRELAGQVAEQCRAAVTLPGACS